MIEPSPTARKQRGVGRRSDLESNGRNTCTGSVPRTSGNGDGDAGGAKENERDRESGHLTPARPTRQLSRRRRENPFQTATPGPPSHRVRPAIAHPDFSRGTWRQTDSARSDLPARVPEPREAPAIECPPLRH